MAGIDVNRGASQQADGFRGSLQRQEVEVLNAILTALTSMQTTMEDTLTALEAIQAALSPSTQIYTVATLPSSPSIGFKAYVTDSNTTTFNATVAGGGSNFVPVFRNNASLWKVG